MLFFSRPGVASLTVLALIAFAGVRSAEAQRNPDEWPAYAGDKASTKYSPLAQIDKGNVDDLEIAWQWESSDYALKEKNSRIRTGNIFELTPLMVDGVLYAITGTGQGVALDPETGEELWVYNPYGEGDDSRRAGPSLGINRGLAHWSDSGEGRVIMISDSHLIALDSNTGKLIEGFGDAGRVDLKEGYHKKVRYYYWSSPPIVCNDVIIIGNSTFDQQTTQEGTPGDVRGYDVRTGRHLWSFHIVPHEGEFGRETWEDGSADYTGHANVWTWMSADEELGYVYLPTSTPNNDWYGGHRLGDGLFAESIVCLDAKTGKRVWHFQGVHHGIWDYDFPCAPVLCDITVDGRKIKALAQISKQAFCYVFDRDTGEPVWPIEERPVPASTVPGERASPTQPFPTKPPAFDLQGITEDDLIDFTPELRAEAVEIMNRYVHGPIFTPPSQVYAEGGTQGTLQVPAPIGGGNWNGAAYDPETQTLFVPSVTWALNAAVVPASPRLSNLKFSRGGNPFIDGPQGLPLMKPPWGRITAIDLSRGENRWVVPNGEGPRDHPALKGLDLPWLGQPGRAGVLVTKTMLFAGEGSSNMIATPPFGGGKKFRAYDKATGEVIWETELPAGTTGSPMTYRVNGKQFVVVAVGGESTLGQLVAFSLMKKPLISSAPRVDRRAGSL